jgi:predicted ABC-type transport system involved in lysophospholipase L1 biosynthesis ATPase subunit
MATVTFDKATRHYPGAERPAVDALDLEIGDGEFLVLVGPSGCGKSTSLRMLAGLEPVDGGAIRIGDRDVSHVDPSDRDIAMVFQNYALYPHMTVAANMGFALKIAGKSKSEIDQRVKEAAAGPRPHPVPRPQAQGAVRRPAPARRHGPRDRPQPAGVLHGRAAVEPRRQAARRRPARRSPRCSAASASPPSTSPTTRSRP